ncbi:hypothetical protein VTK26DRAFT_6335 [Humicola hyalothermophila]
MRALPARLTTIVLPVVQRRATSRLSGVESVSVQTSVHPRTLPQPAVNTRVEFPTDFATTPQVALERRLSIDNGEEALSILTADAEGSAASQPPAVGSGAASASEGGSPLLPSPCRQQQSSWENEIHVKVPITPTSIPLAFSTFKFPPTPPSPPKTTFVDDLMRADLDQLYFDRAHPNVPIFNHSRYFARSRENARLDGPKHMLCLQYAMWTLATALSSQFESSREQLYYETRQMLEGLELVDDDMHPPRIEQVQAWLLIAFYEFARSSYRRASISAGRAFRLVQLSRLHQVDAPDNLIEGEDSVVTEEKRRTFWVAYCLDRLICMQSRGPLTLTDEVICTRLPCPELPFQSGHPLPSCHLKDAIASGDHNLLSPFAESVILVNICGRALSHYQLLGAERASGSSPLDFWVRHECLDVTLTRMLDSLSMTTPIVSAMTDPMLLFAFMMGHATTIYMSQILETFGMEGQCLPNVDYQSRAAQAACEIAGLAKAHEHIGFFKAHIFLPLAVFMGASQLRADWQRIMATGLGVEAECTSGAQFQACMDALRKMQSFNGLARDHLNFFESQEFTVASL